jgi:hypothetical protein
LLFPLRERVHHEYSGLLTFSHMPLIYNDPPGDPTDVRTDR